MNAVDTASLRTYERVPYDEILTSDEPGRFVTYEHPVLFDPPHLDRKAVIASTVGTTIEWYDFLLYSIVTPLVFGKLFFHHSEPLIGVLEAFAVYFVGFVGRPIGAFIFGMTSLCIVYAGWDANWFKAFLGIMLLLAVMVNLYVKRLSTRRKMG